MKAEVIKALKEKGMEHLYTDERLDIIKEVIKIGMKRDYWLKMYLSLDPLNKAQFAADQIITLVEKGKI